MDSIKVVFLVGSFTVSYCFFSPNRNDIFYGDNVAKIAAGYADDIAAIEGR